MIESISFLVGGFPYILLPVLIVAATVFTMISWKRKQYGRWGLSALVLGGIITFAATYVGTLNSVSLTFGEYSFGAVAIVGAFIVSSYAFVALVKFLNKASGVLTEHIEERIEVRETQYKLDQEREAVRQKMENIDKQIEAAEQRLKKKNLLKRIIS